MSGDDTPESFLDGRVALWRGDCLDVLARIPDASVDSVVCDPPYHLTSIVKRFGAENAAPAKSGKTGAYKRASAGFMGKQWDGGDIAFRVDLWAQVLRVLKPGGHVVAFSGTRTYHRMACAIEDAAFEIRDQIGWAYGSGFPKSHDIAKAIVNRLGYEREKVRVDASDVRNPKATGAGRDGVDGASRPWIEKALARGYHEKDSNKPASEQGADWAGWGTALKPAWEPIVVARKQLIGTVAENVLKHGTGALNIDGCRVGTAGATSKSASKSATVSVGAHLNAKAGEPIDAGRWPANIVHDGSDEVISAFPESESTRGVVTSKPGAVSVNGAGLPSHSGLYGFDDSGSAARFFYSAKADADDRIGSKHPTVKPVDLMQWLVRLVTPKGGLVLDPFAGTGTTGEAAFREGMRAVLIEREEEYQNDIRRRMKLCLAGPDEKRRESLKARGLVDDAGPLFGGSDSTRGGADKFTESSRTKNRTDWVEGIEP